MSTILLRGYCNILLGAILLPIAMQITPVQRSRFSIEEIVPTAVPRVVSFSCFTSMRTVTVTDTIFKFQIFCFFDVFSSVLGASFIAAIHHMHISHQQVLQDTC